MPDNSDPGNLSQLLNEGEFLSKLTATLSADWKELDNYLQQSQWPQARNKAHQLAGIFNLFHDQNLLNSLQQIEHGELPAISTPEFRKQLRQQISCFCLKIEQYISN